MGFNRPKETRLEVSGYTRAHEPGTILWNIERALENHGVELEESEPEYYKYGDLNGYKVTLIIEEV